MRRKERKKRLIVVMREKWKMNRGENEGDGKDRGGGGEGWDRRGMLSEHIVLGQEAGEEGVMEKERE